MKKIIPFEKGDGEKVAVMGLPPNVYLLMPDGTKIFCLDNRRVTLFLITPASTYIESKRYEPAYVEE